MILIGIIYWLLSVVYKVEVVYLSRPIMCFANIYFNSVIPVIYLKSQGNTNHYQ